MKTFLAALLVAVSAIASFAEDTNVVPPSPSIAKDSRCFELRTYHTAPGKLEDLNKRFREHTCALFRKHGIEIVGFWLPTDSDKGAENTLVYLLAYPNRAEAKKSWAAFSSDPDWKKARTESEANGKIVLKVDSVFLSATDYSTMK